MIVDLKNADIYFEDGTTMSGAINNSKAGAVNNGAGYLAGATSIIVDGFTGILPVGSALTIDGTPGFRITSTAETGGNTTTINFTPALTGAVADDDVVTVSGFAIGATTLVVDGFTGAVPDSARVLIGTKEYTVSSATESGGNTINIVLTSALLAVAADNAAVTIYGVYLRIKVGEGNITWSEKKPREFKLDRGEIDQVRNADEVPMDVSLQLMYEELTASSGDPPTPEDVLKRRGEAVDWVSANTADPCAPYCINIRFDHTPPNCTAVDKERVILPMFYYESLDHDPKQGTISCQGKCNATEAQVTRIAQA
jgi:hypothetical protein